MPHFTYGVRCVALGALLLVGGCEGAVNESVRGYPADALDSLRTLEAVLRATPDTALIAEYARIMSEEPHHAGSPGARAVAEWALDKFREWGLTAHIEEFEALLPTPTVRRVELVRPTRFVAKMQEPVIPQDKDSGDQGQLPTYNAYGADGEVEGDLVFANYGNAEDYAYLDSVGVDLGGKVVIVKYGRGVRSAKIKQAAARGAIAVIIYSDPEDDGFTRGDVYPNGPWRPEDAVQRGTAADYAAMYAGDPLSPGWASKNGSRRLTRAEAKSLPTIPVVPLSYGDARPLLEALGGATAPDDNWKGGLPIAYNIGPGPARVRVRSKSQWTIGPLYNVIGRIEGATAPDEWVIFGNHHDGWVNGMADPVSGAVALMEAARSLSVLVKNGWRPQRTIVFALWDGEEWGLLGSTEWAEEHAAALRDKAVVYFNTDGYSKGVFDADGSHTLSTFVRELARDLRDPLRDSSLADVAAHARLTRARTAADSASARSQGFELGPPGSGTDFEAFLEHLGIASVSHGFSGGPTAGTYHSIYDSYEMFTRFIDPGFLYGKAQATTVATLALRMAEAPILPFSFSDAATAYRGFAQDVVALAQAQLGSEQLDASPVMQAIDRLTTAGNEVERAYQRVTGRGAAFLDQARAPLAAINKALYQSERDLLDPDGLPGREWFKSTMYATGVYTGFAPDPMPGVRQMLQAKQRAAAQDQLQRLAAAIDRMAVRATRVGAALDSLVQ
ncbi:MAG: M28 family peptidase [Gemmatimonadota bacterium]